MIGHNYPIDCTFELTLVARESQEGYVEADLKRRDFLKTSAGLAGTLLPPLVGAQPKPCGPGTVTAVGGTTASVTCASHTAADWHSRSTAPGVVWAHNFEHENEVRNFLLFGSGNDADGAFEKQVGYAPDVRWNPTDGLSGGGCLEMICLQADDAYARDPKHPWSRGSWIRPFSPLLCEGSDPRTGSGTGKSDPGANGSIAPKQWRPWTSVWGQNAGYQCATFRGGVYGHSDYRKDPKRGEPAGWIWEGDQSTGYFIQFQVKIPIHRWVPTRVIDPSNPYFSNTSPVVGKQPVAKYFWAGGVTGNGSFLITPSHELVANGYPRITSPPDPYTNKATHQFRMYTAFGPEFINTLGEWEWPADTWVTILVHVVPGHANSVVSMSGGDSKVRAWAATHGQDYVQLADVRDLALGFGNDLTPLGWNAFIPTNYTNGPDNLGKWGGEANYRDPRGSAYAGSDGPAVTQTWSNKFTQIIFSKEFIPAPR